MAYSLDHILLLDEALDECDVAIGSRDLVLRKQNGKLTWRRTLLHAGLIFLTRITLGLKFHDTQAGIKGFRREAAEKIFNMNEINAYGFDIEILFLAQKFKFSIKEIPATVSPEHSYKLGRSTLFKHSIRAFYDLMKIRINAILGIYD